MSRNNLPHVIRSSRYDAALQRIAGNYERLDAMEMAIEWALGHTPKRFYNFRENYYLWRTDKEIPQFPAMRIVYRYLESDNTVVLESVSLVNDLEDYGDSLWTPPAPDRIDF